VNSPIGVIEDLREDDYGLFIQCRLLLEIPKAKEIYHLLKNKAIDGFSIGYRVKDSYYCNNYQYLTDIDLLEISVVTFPACRSALVDEVKNNRDILQSIREMSNKIKRKFR
jgi:HK97 family phage prohead protease